MSKRAAQPFGQRGASLSFRLIAALLLLLAWSAGGRSLEAQEKSLLWKVSQDGKSIFLLGSIHYLREENYPLNQAILDTFDASKRLVLEIDLNQTSPGAAQRVVLEKAIYRDGSTLAQNISEETYQLTSKRASELGIDMKALQPMKPWFVALTMLSAKLQQMGLNPKLGVDHHLAERAKRNGKPTTGLETLEFQLGMFDQLAKREQESMLRETGDAVERIEKNINGIVESWLKGDGDRLATLMLAGMRAYPELYRKVIVERNQRWLEEITQLVRQGGDALVVVGAAHLVGKDGVVAMLKARGFDAEQK
ncbi:MAG TPA: TraB/GumN family protein [Candidatus Binatia bacterium]